MSKAKIGIALGSGSARGWAHVGVLQALADEDIEPDIVCGCSMGALVGAAYVAGELKALDKWARSMNWLEIVSFLDIDLTSGGLIEGKRLMSFMQSLRDDAPIESFEKPFLAIATELATGREVWLQQGSIVDAVRASIALPGLLSPVELDGKWLLDGGLVNPVPVSACRALGADIIIAVNLNGDLVGKHTHRPKAKKANEKSVSTGLDVLDRLLKEVPSNISKSLKKLAPDLLVSGSKTPGYFDVGATAINIMQDQITRSRLAGEPPHIMLTPQLRDLGILEFNRAEEAIEEGRKSVERILPSLAEYL
jgi:NTE family protein